MKMKCKELLFKKYIAGEITTPAYIAGIKIIEYKFCSKKGLKEKEIYPVIDLLSDYINIVQNWKQIVVI